MKNLEIGGIYKSDTNLYLDLSLVSSGFTGEKMVASGGRMLVLDRDQNKLVSIEFENKKGEKAGERPYKYGFGRGRFERLRKHIKKNNAQEHPDRHAHRIMDQATKLRLAQKSNGTPHQRHERGA